MKKLTVSCVTVFVLFAIVLTLYCPNLVFTDVFLLALVCHSAYASFISYLWLQAFEFAWLLTLIWKPSFIIYIKFV